MHPKKGFDHIRSKATVNDVFEFIQSNGTYHYVKQAYQTMGVRQSKHYARVEHELFKLEKENRNFPTYYQEFTLRTSGVMVSIKFIKL